MSIIISLTVQIEVPEDEYSETAMQSLLDKLEDTASNYALYHSEWEEI